MRVIDVVFYNHNLLLVLFAVVVCVSGSWIAMGLLQQAQNKRGIPQGRWITVTAVGMGSAIWCTHFTAMMGFHPRAEVTLNAPITMLSLAVAVIGSAAGIWIALALKSRIAPALGGAVAGVGIVLMHYTGMYAYEVMAPVEWSVPYIVASILVAVIVSAAAFQQILARPWRFSPMIGKLSFALAIVALHMLGMSALQIICAPGTEIVAPQEAFATMGIAIACVGLLTISGGLTTHLIESYSTHETLARFQHMALTDALTGLPNRASFSERLQADIQQAKTLMHKLAVILIDLDRFKEINDLRGHQAGDRALQIIASRLAAVVDEDTFFARLGGDEFAATVRFLEERQLVDIVTRLETTLFEPIQIDDFTTVTGASIGVAIYPADGRDSQRLLSNADLAMYRAKADIANAVCFFEARMDELVHERHALAQDLRGAVERDELQLFYQVQTSVSTGQVLGYEALLRWNHPQRGLVSPAEFIPIAEETGMILSLGEWALREACREAAAWEQPHKISVNISPIQFAHVDLAKLVFQVLVESGLTASRLELEITESTIIADKKRTLHMLRQIRALGVTVAIDDFGIGYSSLDTLRAFPFDKIKLDRSFMHEVERDVQAKAIVRAVLALGKSLNIPVLAEGVETTDQLEILKVEGCDEAQGFLLGKPRPTPEPVAEPEIPSTVVPLKRVERGGKEK